MSAALADRIAEAVAAHDFGSATARKTGRDQRWPHVPVIRHHTGGLRGDGYQEQLLRRAFATRPEAVEYAGKVIAMRKADLAANLAEARMRALRRQHGLPEEIDQ